MREASPAFKPRSGWACAVNLGRPDMKCFPLCKGCLGLEDHILDKLLWKIEFPEHRQTSRQTLNSSAGLTVNKMIEKAPTTTTKKCVMFTKPLVESTETSAQTHCRIRKMLTNRRKDKQEKKEANCNRHFAHGTDNGDLKHLLPVFSIFDSRQEFQSYQIRRDRSTDTPTEEQMPRQVRATSDSRGHDS